MEIKPEQFTSVLTSDLMSNTLTYFSTFRPMTQQVKEADYTNHLNELILCIQLTNGKRSDTLAYLRKSEVSNAKTVQGMKVAFVSSGKTVQTYGPSKVVFSPEVYSTVKAVGGKVHKALGINHDHLFSTYSGTHMTEKQITRYVQAAWKEHFTSSINNNLIRKSIVSMSRENPLVTRDQQTELAHQMDYSVNTADRHYDICGGRGAACVCPSCNFNLGN